MSPAIALIIGVAVAVVLAASASVYLWRVRRLRLETREGLNILAAMRWRELSNLIVDALASSGFEREPPQDRAKRGSHGDVVLIRDGRPWLLSFRQGVGAVVSRPMVEELARAVRVQQAAGGLAITLGRVEPAARHVAPNIELVDGNELWKLVEHRLPQSVHAEVQTRARSGTLRSTAIAVAAASIGGFALAWALTLLAPPADPPAPALAQPALPQRPAVAPVMPATPAPVPVAPRSEEEQRLELAGRVASVAGVERAIWSTRSTLQIFAKDAAGTDDKAICAAMLSSDLLRASRLQIQGPAGSSQPVRFMQCATY